MTAIYTITHTATGHEYIGSSKWIKSRLANHKCLLKQNRHANQRLQNYWNKYGEAAFEFNIIEEGIPEDDLVVVEQRYIDERKPFFNIRKIAQSNRGLKQSEEQKRKASEYAKTRTGDKNPFYGKKHSEETRQVNVEKHTGVKLSEETKAKISEAHKGRKRPEHAAFWEARRNAGKRCD